MSVLFLENNKNTIDGDRAAVYLLSRLQKIDAGTGRLERARVAERGSKMGHNTSLSRHGLSAAAASQSVASGG